MRKIAFIAFTLAVIVAGDQNAALAQSKSKAESLKKNLKSVESKKSSIQKQLRVAKRETTYVLQDIEKADMKLESVSDQIHSNWERQAQLKKERERLAAELQVAERALTKQSELVQARMRQIYVQPEGTAIGALLSSKDLGDLASRKAIFNRIAEQDADLFTEFKAKRDEVDKKKKRQEELINLAKQLEASQRQHQYELLVHKKNKKGYLAELEEKKNDLAEQYAALDRESDRIAAQLQAFQVRSSGVKFSGRFIAPVSARISSGYGMRFHPVLKRNRMHTGIDFAASAGTSIKAAASGVVVSAGYFGGYGNAVIIDHGGGIATLYGHCSRVFVSSGQRVSQGQRIAAVGSTGLSTGPHLHFEVRVNGRPVNPAGRL